MSGQKDAPRRDARETAARIAEAALEVFGTRGFEAAGTREIAERAGVNVALINRYFGSKEGLFAATVPPSLRFDLLLEADLADLGARIAALYLNKTVGPGYDPMLAILRSAFHPDAAPKLRAAVQEQIIAPFATRLGGADAEVRAELFVTQLAGISLWRQVLGGGVSGAAAKALERRLGAQLQALIDDRQPEPA